ncbi:uncharacterized protein NECHADRAFT_88184 [Fusarium vanettenii 77-13-4]|uniref:Uncharacterized protein n=1 Tax=Fusarium vanettenii (strain ATCC MYA-4622 / CBS 123669 / FGSC 9596 / NRRL 45880 / 77-13-4) TaxID=660122 RepID=C7ZDF7_FUSV7|nr:uncharacterized protein NECHADRAFT_88184 [Fusarium vanettenii 77-13-4]EEU37773.1 predicted protein [Fusarium vanettenii 77-13-4]
MAANTYRNRLRIGPLFELPFIHQPRTKICPSSELDLNQLDWSDYFKRIMASADKAALKAEKGAEEAAKRAERLSREVEKISSDTTSATAPTPNAAAIPSFEELAGHMATARFWLLALLIIINNVIVGWLLHLGKPETKPETRFQQRAPSPGHTEQNLACLESCITTRPRRIFATVLCRTFMGLYLLQSYWALNAILRLSWITLGEALKESNPWFAIFMILMAVANLVISGGGTGVCLYLALSQQLALDGALALLPVHVDVGSDSVRDDEEKSRHDAHGARGQEETDEISVELESEGDWEKDGF